jgi:hypothetical protein
MLQLNQICRQIYFIAVKPVEVEVQMYVLSIFGGVKHHNPNPNPFLFWPLCCLSFNVWIMITPLESSNSSNEQLTITFAINRQTDKQ